MSLSEGLDSPLFFTRLISQFRNFSESISSTANCTSNATNEECRDEPAALQLKLIAICAILIAGILGIAIPLLGRKWKLLEGTGGGAGFILTKAFAAGVILATGFVHMLKDSEEALTDPCLPEIPWKKFPFSGFVAMLAALGTLMLDFLATQFYEGKHSHSHESNKASASNAQVNSVNEIIIVEHEEPAHEIDHHHHHHHHEDEKNMHIIGMHAHDYAHVHDSHNHVHNHNHVHETNGDSQARHVVVSQILELGIISHSVIIGLSLGVSQSPCTIKPLIAALSFHQFFEGFALGGCIAEAQFKNMSQILMSTFFAITTPTGIGCGAALASFYNANSARALIVEGILDSISAGILIYMALVDLIAADFLSRRVSCELRVQVGSYLFLILGALCMSSLAIWA
ncbi:hypothetical protein LUZ60_012331 [Juncus effusus]|nr:hypothetical protein LUZ60_012331 [Juncus effusus]